MRSSDKRRPLRDEIPAMWMMYGMRAGWTPNQFMHALGRTSHLIKESRSPVNHISRAWDSLVCSNKVTRSDIYFSVPCADRAAIERARMEAETRPESDANRGLFRTVRDAVSPLQIGSATVEACLRFGPLHTLYGDLYANLRRYELLTWGILYGSAQIAFPGGQDEEWRDLSWWRSTLGDSSKLLNTWARDSTFTFPWQAADLGDLATMSRKLMSTKRTEGVPIGEAFHKELVEVNRIRNLVAHPLGQRNPNDNDFQTVGRALQNVVDLADHCLTLDVFPCHAIPAERDLGLTELLRSRLRRQHEEINDNRPYRPVKSIGDPIEDFSLWKGIEGPIEKTDH